MEREARFQEMLKDLCMLAKVNKNKITKQLVEEFFEELELKEEQLELIYAYLKEQKIQILEKSEAGQTGMSDQIREDGLNETAETETTEADRVFDKQIEALCMEVVRGDNSKKQEILEAYEPKIKQYVKDFLGSGLLEEDLLQEARLGLFLALEALTVKAKEMSFAEYLEAGIENEIRNVLEEELQTERADEELEKQVNRFHNRLVELGEELEHKPAVEEVCMYMEMSKEEVDYYFRLMGDGNNEE